jgi:hypothetical protein
MEGNDRPSTIWCGMRGEERSGREMESDGGRVRREKKKEGEKRKEGDSREGERLLTEEVVPVRQRAVSPASRSECSGKASEGKEIKGGKTHLFCLAAATSTTMTTKRTVVRAKSVHDKAIIATHFLQSPMKGTQFASVVEQDPASKGTLRVRMPAPVMYMTE